ncbi:MAG: hypothetical protein ACTHJ9_06335 [Rhodanobacter sp.]
MRNIALGAGTLVGIGVSLIAGAYWFVRASLPFAAYMDPKRQEPLDSEAHYIRAVSNGPQRHRG